MSYNNAIDLVSVAARAASARGVDLLEIMELLAKDYRTAQRYAAALQRCFPETERFRDEETGRFRWRLPRRSIAPLLVPTAEELAAMTVAETMLETSPGSDQAHALRRLHAKMLALIPDGRSLRLETDEEALLVALGHAVRPGPRHVAAEAVDQAISMALKGVCPLRVRYRGWNDEKPRDRVLGPHGLLLGMRRYLVAVDLEKIDGPMQHFRVDAIEEAEVLTGSFCRIEGFSIAEHAGRCFGSFQDADELKDVAWLFSLSAVDRAEGFVFHPSQVVERGEDGSLTVRFRASGLLEMCWHLYMWGDAVEVLSPPELVAMIEGHRRGDFPSLP